VIKRTELLKDLQRQMRLLEDDLREQVDAVRDLHLRLRAEYDQAFQSQRTAATWTVWRDERVTQAAAAWVLGTVFVRFCEDNDLLATRYLAGPTVERMTLAEEAQEQFIREHPSETDRGWLLAAFDAIAAVPAGAFLFSERHNPLYQIPVSHDAAKALIAFWRRRGGDGRLIHDFGDPAGWDSRFLGDLYQDLSESARKTYALLQTPEFVEEFILDRTLTPAIDEFGHDQIKLIDPTCGSGHFLLGAFHRLLAEWERNAPGRDQRERVSLALEAVHGVDVNPFAVAIARFRLLLAALRAAGFTTLAETAGYTFPINVAVGDSLLKGRQLAFETMRDDLAEFAYSTEDVHEFPGMLVPGRYHVVVGNPPYITVKDRNLNQRYRELYDACHMQYALTVPFAQRFFELARRAGVDGRGAGYVGQITANSFMKREFGKKLIEEFFAHKVELTHVIDSSGAYIPGHSTPTVILIGRNKHRDHGEVIRAVMGVQGEPGVPDDASKGLVWRAIVEQIDNPDLSSQWVSVADLPRDALNRYPWSLSGGGAGDLQASLSALPRKLNEVIDTTGRTTHTGLDEAFYLPKPAAYTRSLQGSCVPVVLGEDVRDFTITAPTWTLFPYDHQGLPRDIQSEEHLFLWPMRTVLRQRVDFGQHPEERGLRWFDHSMFFAKRYVAPLSIVFAFVATHNHFVLDHGGKVFNRSAPVIKLPEGAGEEEHLRLLGVLNSSIACFWLKQVSQPKGGSGIGRGVQDEPWESRYEFTGTKLEEFPLPKEFPLDLARLDGLAQRMGAVTPAAVAEREVPTRERLAVARLEWESVRGRMIALQEELDWRVYALYGLLDEELTASSEAVPELSLGERAFEIVLARRMAAGEVETEWFARHGSTPITEIPGRWPAEYRARVEKRIAVIESNRNVGLIERPECKRRWATEGWDAMQARALREWLLDRCERRELWFHEVDEMEQPRLLTTAQLADELRADPDVVSVAELYARGKDLAEVVAGLVAEEHVPYLAALRNTDEGLGKRADWEHVWDKQREEDATSTEEEKRKIRKTFPVPPKYAPRDFLRSSYWRNRGKLDVPKERFISYPHASRDSDPALLLGWAGWDHREQAQALAILIVEREQRDGWGAEPLTPLLAGLREVLPWVWQWDGEFDPLYGGSPAAVYAGFLADYQNRLHLSDALLAAWRPQKTARGRNKRA
jgi:hypothetical protein